MSKSAQSSLILLSVFALLNVMFVPIFDVWGGLLPSDVDVNFFEVLELFAEDSYGRNLWVVQISMSIFVPSIFMFITSLVGSRGLFIVSNGIGIFLWFRQIANYCQQQDDIDCLFDFEDGNISIGTWIAIAIFICAMITAINSNNTTQPVKEQAVPTTDSLAYAPKPYVDNHVNNIVDNTIENTVEPIAQVNKFCSNCGAPTKEGATFCGKCGRKLKG